MWRAFVMFGLGLALALLLDQTVRLLLPPSAIQNSHWYAQTVRYHPILGWSGVPDFVATKDGISIQTNSLGYRDREPALLDDSRKPSVLFLGDSFTWGDEVSVEERFSSLLETSCGSFCDRVPSIHAINRGIIGYGTTQSLLDYLLSRDERPFEAVVLALYAGNDLTDNADIQSPTGPRPRLIACNRESAPHHLCLEGVPVPSTVDWPEHRLIDPRGRAAGTLGWTGMATLASQRRAPRFLIDSRIAARMRGGLNDLPFPRVERTSTAPIEDRLGQLESILRALDEIVHDDGREFGVLTFPSARVYAGDPDGELHEYRQVLAVLDRLDIPFADYYETTKNFRLEALYSGDQGHWRPSGHQEAAEQLRSLLARLEERPTLSQSIDTVSKIGPGQ